MWRIACCRLCLLAVALIAGSAWAVPLANGTAGPIWFYEAAPGVWRGDGAVRLTWEVAAGGPTLTIREAGKLLRVQYVGGASTPQAGLCPGRRAPLRWFTGSGHRPLTTVESGDCFEVRDLWPGITLRLSRDAGRLKADYLVEPGASVEDIRLRFEQAEHVRIEPSGELLIKTSEGEWREDAPRAWVEGGEAVSAAFRITGESVAGFEVAAPPGRRLVIDPAISYSGVFGGSGTSAASAMALDGGGAVYVGGYTDSADFPMNASILPRAGGVDGVVFKLEGSTGRLLWANYVGGSADDRVHALVIGADGSVYAAGATTSAGFPTSGSGAVSNRGGSDAFVMRFSADGTRLEFSTCFGGTLADSAFALARSSSGVWLGGQTASTNLPIIGGPQSSLRGATDAFLARYSAGGALEFSTYLGGSGEEILRTIAVTSTGDPVIGGSTGSADLTLPAGAFQPSLRGALDGFVLKLSASTGQVLAGTFLGGGAGTAGAPERVEAIAVDGAQNVYAAGFTPSSDFPTPNAWLGTLGGVRDGFLVKLHPGLNGLSWGTFLGGGGQETIQSIALLGDGKVAVGGSTTSVNFPLQDPVVSSYRGGGDGFVTVFTPDGMTVPFSTYLGGSSADVVHSISAGPGNALIAAGQSGSLDLPLRGPAAAPSGSALRVFVSRIALGPMPVIESVSPGSGTGSQGYFDLVVSHSGGAGQIASIELAFGDLLTGGPNCRVVWTASSGAAWVVPEPGFTKTSVVLGSSAVSAGGACTLSGQGSNVSAGGSSVTLRLNLSFPRNFAGSRTISADAVDSSGAESGFSTWGSWQVPNAANLTPSVVSVEATPAQGASALFSVTVSDGNGSGDIARVKLLVGPSTMESGACAVEFDRVAGVFRLVNDTGTGWHSARPEAAVTLANSVCQLKVATSRISAQASTLVADFDLAFTQSYAGLKNVYAMAIDTGGAQTPYSLSGTFRADAANNLPPAFVSLTPAGGGGTTQRFTLIYADGNGAADVTGLRIRIHSQPQDAGGCSFEVNRVAGQIRLRDDSGSNWVSSPIGSGTAISNTQCEVRPATAAITTEGTQIRLDVDVAFRIAFNGSRTIWTSAEDSTGASSGWVQSGSYNVAVVVSQAPVALSVGPSTGSGPSVTMTVTVSDINGALDISTVRLLINAQQAAAGGCYVAFNRHNSQVSLATDSGSDWTAAAAGTQTILSNSQCSVNAGGTLFAISGSNLIVSLQITFKPQFNGAKLVWANGTDAGGLTGDSPLLGSYTVAVPVNSPPAPLSITPNSGSGAAQVFTMTWTDPNGGADIVRGEVLISSVQSAAWGCYLQVRPSQGTVSLAADDGASWTPVQAGAAAVASNSQCTLRGSGTSIQVSGATLVVMLDLSFKSGFNGPKSIWANALDQSNLLSSSPLVGTFTVSATAPKAPVPAQVSPASGSGGGQVLQFVWTDDNGASDILWGRVLINSIQQAGSGCYFAVNPSDGSVMLADDSGELRLKVRLGMNEAAANTQCSIQGAGSSVQLVGSTLSAYVDLRFKPAFNGLKFVWMNATDRSGLTSPSPQLGTFDVFSSAASAPAPVSVSPPSASGSRQTFSFTWRDANGAHDIAFARVLIHSAQRADLGCYFQVDTASGMVLLANDAATNSFSLTLGANQSIENGQCRIQGAGSWAARNGDTLTVLLDVVFKPAFTGAKSIWMNATDHGGLTSASPQLGSYTVTP